MMLLCGQSNRIWHYWAGRHPGSVGLLVSPDYFKKVPLDPWMPFALDNGAFAAWRDKTPWGAEKPALTYMGVRGARRRGGQCSL